MLMGSFAAVVASFYSGSALIGVASAVIAGMIVAVIFALLTVNCAQTRSWWALPQTS